MFYQYLRSIIMFLVIGLIFSTLILVNFYHAQIHAGGAIPLLSIVLALFISGRFCLYIIYNKKIKQDFVTIVTHKFRTPITGLKWAIDNLKDTTLSQQERSDILKRMDESTGRLLEIVDLIVGDSKFDRRIGYMHELSSMREMIETSLVKYAEQIRAKNITFKVDAGMTVPNIIIDKRKMQFVVDVVINNALTYTPAGGMVTISFSLKNDTIVMKIQDTGIGFGFFDQRRIFGSFFRSSAARTMDTEGMGLGLYTAKKIVAAHGGKIWAHSAGVNKGATFYIELKKEL